MALTSCIAQRPITGLQTDKEKSHIINNWHTDLDIAWSIEQGLSLSLSFPVKTSLLVNKWLKINTTLCSLEIIYTQPQRKFFWFDPSPLLPANCSLTQNSSSSRLTSCILQQFHEVDMYIAWNYTLETTKGSCITWQQKQESLLEPLWKESACNPKIGFLVFLVFFFFETLSS